MEDLSLHIFDIIENAVRAEAAKIAIAVIVHSDRNVLEITIRDNGTGMDDEQRMRCEDPFFTTKACKKTGLGISLFKQSALEAMGSFSLSSSPSAGTIVTASFVLDHLDRKPLGDLAKTLSLALAAFPDTDFRFTLGRDEKVFEMDTEDIREELGDIPISAPDVVKTLREHITGAVRTLGIR